MTDDKRCCPDCGNEYGVMGCGCPAMNSNSSMACDQCQAVMINGVYCHEQGCPNANHDPRPHSWAEEQGSDT